MPDFICFDIFNCVTFKKKAAVDIILFQEKHKIISILNCMNSNLPSIKMITGTWK